MPLTFDELVAILTPTAGTLNVRAPQLQTPAIDGLWGAYLKDATLSLINAKAIPDDGNQTVAVTGDVVGGTILHIAAAKLSASTFALTAGGAVDVQMTVAVTDVNWTMATSFPTLRGSVFDGFQYNGPSFGFDSTAPVVLPPDFHRMFGYPASEPAVAARMVKGLTFTASLVSKDPTASSIAKFFKSPLTVAGPIESLTQDVPTGEEGDQTKPEQMPEMLLTLEQTGLSKTLQLGEYTFEFDLQVATLFQEAPGEGESPTTVLPTAVFGIRTAFDNGETPPIPMSLYLYGDDNPTLRFNAGQPPASTLQKNQLAGLLNGAEAGDLLDPGEGFPLVDHLTLQSASIGFSLDPAALHDITIDVALVNNEEGWQPFGADVITFERFGFLVSAVNSGATFQAEASAYTRAYLAGNENIELTASITLPTLRIAAELAIDETLDLKQLVFDLVGEDIPLPVITGSVFALSADVRRKRYDFEAVIQQTWVLFGDEETGLVLKDIQILLAATKEPDSAATEVTGSVFGQLTLAGANLTLSAGYRGKDAGWVFTGGTSPGQAINLTALFGELASLFGSELPPGLPDILLSELELQYATKDKAIDFRATVKLEKLAFELTSIPLIGEHLDPSSSVALESITFAYTQRGTNKNAELQFVVALGTLDAIIVTIPLTKKKEGAEALAEPPKNPITYPTAGSGVFIPIERSFGPVRFQKLGFTLDESGVGVQFVGALATAKLSLDLLGLEVIVPLSAPFTPSFDLHGLGLSLQAGSVAFSGALLKIEQGDYLQFDGAILVKAGKFGATAVGSYATTDPPSFFAFAIIDVPIGGPPYFFITGVAGGIGFNRDLKIPPIERVLTFPLVAGADKATNPFGPDTASFVSVMSSSMGVSMGTDWVAAGIKFTSFKTIDSYALISVLWGTRLQVAFLGLSTISVPPLAETPVAMAQLIVMAVYDSAAGTFFIAAQLTPNSYVLSKKAMLTGGFAMYFWFDPNDHAGEFVVTLGGYNNYYVPPDYYPKVPRLGLKWQVSEKLVIKGGLYFAVTPQAIMAGGFLNATWDSGSIRAWFDLYADFLIYWKPFHYDIRLGVNFGVQANVEILFVRVTININIGADLHLWGPEFAGEANIHLSVLSFTIRFGDSSAKAPPALLWPEFRDSFLTASNSSPQTAAARAAGEEAAPAGSVVLAAISEGILQTLTNASVQFIVDPQRFVLTTSSLVPSKRVSVNGVEEPVAWNVDYVIGPMQLGKPQELESEHVLVVKKGADLYGRLDISVDTGKSPKALWIYDPNLHEALNTPAVIDDVVLGLTVRPHIDEPSRSLTIDIKDLLYDVVDTVTTAWGADLAPSSDPWSGDDPFTKLAETIGQESVAATRGEILVDLFYNGFGVQPATNVAPLQNVDDLHFLDPIVLHELGENTAKGGARG